MTKTDKFFKNLDISIKKSFEYGLPPFKGLQFRDYRPEKNQEIIKKINNYFYKIIKDRDSKNNDRYITAMDCSGMSILLYRY
ncbi:MAG: hypothetical protein DSY46_00730, partial [Hydrogenimonas sp.]